VDRHNADMASKDRVDGSGIAAPSAVSVMEKNVEVQMPSPLGLPSGVKKDSEFRVSLRSSIR